MIGSHLNQGQVFEHAQRVSEIGKSAKERARLNDDREGKCDHRTNPLTFLRPICVTGPPVGRMGLSAKSTCREALNAAYQS